MVVAASSINLIGTMRAINLTNLGSGWVVSTPPSGGPYTRRIGTTAEAAECHLERTGKLVFYTGSTPVAGEQIAVSYRTIGRAVGRAVNTASQQALAQAGSPAVAAWIGSVTNPAGAQFRGLPQCGAGDGAGGGQRERAVERHLQREQDQLCQRCVAGRCAAAECAFDQPERAGGGADGEGELSAPVIPTWWSMRSHLPTTGPTTWPSRPARRCPANTWLPAPVAPTVLANLNSLTVTTLNGSTVTINAGVTPPTGGGFEIRRRDFAFMPGEDPTLVLRGSQPNMTFSRVSANDRFYIRMYDGSTPPNYSEFSTALFINLPLGS